MGNKVTKVKKVGDKTVVSIYNKSYKIGVKASVNVHEDDKPFANDLTGERLARYKADAVYHEKMAKAKQREADALRQLAKDLDVESLEHAQVAEVAKSSFKTLVDGKDVLYKTIARHREDGGYKSVEFEKVGDLLKDAPKEVLEQAIKEGEK